jgi:hypothetical protein
MEWPVMSLLCDASSSVQVKWPYLLHKEKKLQYLYWRYLATPYNTQWLGNQAPRICVPLPCATIIYYLCMRVDKKKKKLKSLTLFSKLYKHWVSKKWFSGSRVVTCRLLSVPTGHLEGGEHYYTGPAMVNGRAGHSPRVLCCNGYTLPYFVHNYY